MKEEDSNLINRYEYIAYTEYYLNHFINDIIINNEIDFYLNLNDNKQTHMKNSLITVIMGFITIMNHEKIINKFDNNKQLKNEAVLDEVFEIYKPKNKKMFLTGLRNALAHGDYQISRDMKFLAYNVNIGKAKPIKINLSIDFLIKLNDKTLQTPFYKLSNNSPYIEFKFFHKSNDENNQYSDTIINSNEFITNFFKVNDEKDLKDLLRSLYYAEIFNLSNTNKYIKDIKKIHFSLDEICESIFNSQLFFNYNKSVQEKIIYFYIRNIPYNFNIHNVMRIIYDIILNLNDKKIVNKLLSSHKKSLINVLNLIRFYNLYIYNFEDYCKNNFPFDNLILRDLEYYRDDIKDKKNFIRHIRNCLSHLDRVETNNRFYDDYYLFTDYDKNGDETFHEIIYTDDFEFYFFNNPYNISQINNFNLKNK